MNGGFFIEKSSTFMDEVISVLGKTGKKWSSQITYGLLVLIFLLGLFLRFYQFPERFPWFGDTARDALVSKHIWKYEESISIGHYASGLPVNETACQVRAYPSYYYHSLATLWSLTHSLAGVMAIITILHASGIIVAFLIVSLYLDKKAGLVAALLYAVSIDFIGNAYFLTTIHVPIPVLLLAIYSVLLGVQRQKRWLTVLGLSGIIYLSAYHYSILLFFIFFFFVVERSFAKSNFRCGLRNTLLFGSLYFGFFLLLHGEVIRTCNGILPFLQSFFSQGSNELSVWSTLKSFWLLLSYHFFVTFQLWTESIAILIFILLADVFFNLKKLRGVLIGTVLLTVFFLMGGAVFPNPSMEMQQIQTMYSRQLIFFLAAFGFGGSLFIAVKKRNYFRLIGLYFVFIALTLSVSLSFFVFRPAVYSTPMKELAEYLLKRPEFGSAKAKFISGDGSDYDTVILAYWLEELSGKQLYQIVNGSAENRTNYVSINDNSMYIFFICNEFVNNEESPCFQAMKDFQEVHPNYIFSQEFLTIKNFSIYFFKPQGEGK